MLATSLDLNQFWTDVQSQIHADMTEISYNTWVKPISLIGIVDDTLYFEVPNEFTQKMLSSRYEETLHQAVLRVSNQVYKTIFLLPGQKEHVAELKNDVMYGQEGKMSAFHPRYTFDSFVIGSGNRFAHAAALAVAETPAKAYNPLFIYGASGLGKTHLMHAIGHFIEENQPDLKLLYVSGEKFTNDLITAISTDKRGAFRNRYRNVDVLFIDDIHFIAGKPSTQEELFHTFNALHEANKQLVLSSDRPPIEIPTLEERLRSRFAWGLIADIAPPDIETRVAILRKKADIENISISNDTLFFIASKIESNIRELEGSLTRVVLFANLNRCAVSQELAERALKDILPPEKEARKLTMHLIEETVQQYFNLRPDELRSQKRNRNIAFPRQIAMFMGRELLSLSLPKIGEHFGGRDHTTVIYACEKVQNALQTDLHVRNTVNDIKKQLIG